MANLKSDDLNKRARRMRSDQFAGRMPPDVALSYLLAVKEVTAPAVRFASMNREQAVEGGLLVNLVLALKDASPELRAAARGVVQHLCLEPTLLRRILVSAAVPALLRGLDEDSGTQSAVLLVMDSIASAAVILAPLPHHDNALAPEVPSGLAMPPLPMMRVHAREGLREHQSA